MLPFARSRTAPTGYEKVRLLFHAIRSAQLISSAIVVSIVGFFLWWLVHDHYAAPWTFVILTLSSFLTLIVLTATICFHLLTGLNPKVNLVLNAAMLALWSLGFSMLTYWSWGTLTHQCSASRWEGPDGIMVCKCYKTLFTFTLTGLLSTASALALDLHIHRLATRYGTHMRLSNIDAKSKSRVVVDVRATTGPHVDADDIEDYPSRHSDAFEVPRVGYGAGLELDDKQAQGLLRDEETRNEGHFDFDTGYRGGHEDRVFGVAR